MRTLPAILALACFGCTEHPTAGEKALISEVENLVALPKGGGELKCYERHYTILRGKDIEKYAGTALVWLGKRELLIGHYRIGSKPGVHWVKNVDKLPNIMDGGCNDIRIIHVVGIHEKSIPATCSFTYAGDVPEEVMLPVTC
ncbi:MAG: hypothetical protein LBV50_09755 [Novosphingobium sp.]|jgi:hypothetical protein|nr:hypothetical protein [Novosphingobium sp.]